MNVTNNDTMLNTTKKSTILPKLAKVDKTDKTPKKPSKKYNDSLSSYSVDKENPKPITNTRIGDKNGIYGGSYHIPDESYANFLKMYSEEIVAKGCFEYLTEKQLETNGPILIDIDLHYNCEVTSRYHELDHIEELIDLVYLVELKKIYQFDENTKFYIYVQQKPDVNIIEGKKTKDGIHIIIGIKAERDVQHELRKRVIPKAKDLWADFPLINTWDEVFDNSITSGQTGWQLYGSRKPHHDSYRLTNIFEITYDIDDGEHRREPIQINDFDVTKNIEKLSARCQSHPSLFYTSEYLNSRQGSSSNGGQSPRTNRKLVIKSGQENTFMNAHILNIKNQDDLDEAVADFLDSLKTLDYELREAHDYTMALPESYYGEGSFAKWIRVGWALRNINDRLLIVWVALSALSPTFEFSSIYDLYERWQKFDLKNPNGLTKRSIMHWVKQDAFAKYKEIRAKSIDNYLDQTLKSITPGNITNDKNARGCTDFDIAGVLYQLFKDEYVCVSVKNGIWYQLKNHLWVANDSGTTLRKAISTTLRDLYWEKANSLQQQAESINPPDEEKSKRLGELAAKILKICERLGTTSDKKNIMTEARELFYDAHFMNQLDVNPYLLSFKNGVVDFKTKCFRKGYPEDHLSKCTNIEYKPIDEERDAGIIAEIKDFMRKLFPVPELHDYMWEHLASTLIGTCPNQTFCMYIGCGSNGKSLLMDLMSMCLGDYKVSVPLSLITEKRTKIGGLAPEVVALKGARYAVMQEPDSGRPESINVGVMKELTSGLDPITARAPYMIEAVSFIPQFQLALCSNTLLNINSQDHGTWRRIRLLEFMALFTHNPVDDDPDKPYQFKIDVDLKNRLSAWKEVFMSMLVEIVYKTNGIVTDCPMVLASSNKYKEKSDPMSDFVKDRIVRDTTGKVKKEEITNEFKLWYDMNGGKSRIPAPKELHEYIDKRFGKYNSSKRAWVGIRIVCGGDAEENDDDDDDSSCEVNDTISSSQL